jgi:hypothetical protein
MRAIFWSPLRCQRADPGDGFAIPQQVNIQGDNNVT